MRVVLGSRARTVLLGLGRKCLPTLDASVWLPSLRRGQDDWRVLLSAVGAMHVRGAAIDWRAFDRPYSRTRLSLPTYPFARQRYWMDEIEDVREKRAAAVVQHSADAHPLLGSRVPSALAMNQFLASIDLRRVPYLADHQVQGSVIFPGAGYIELALAAAGEVFGAGAHYVENVNLHQALFLDPQDAPLVQVVVSPEVGGRSAFQVFHQAKTDPAHGGKPSAGWTLNAEGSIRRATAADPSLSPKSVAPILKSGAALDEDLDRQECTRRLLVRGLEYGPAFRCCERTWRSDGEAVSDLRMPEVVTADVERYHVHPALLDACIQVIGATVPGDWAPEDSGETFLPVGMRRMRVLGKAHGPLVAHARTRLEDVGPERERVEGDLTLCDEQGRVLLQLEGVQLRRVGQRRQRDAEERIRRTLYAPIWHVANLPASELVVSASSNSAAFDLPDAERDLVPARNGNGSAIHDPLIYGAHAHQSGKGHDRHAVQSLSTELNGGHAANGSSHAEGRNGNSAHHNGVGLHATETKGTNGFGLTSAAAKTNGAGSNGAHGNAAHETRPNGAISHTTVSNGNGHASDATAPAWLLLADKQGFAAGLAELLESIGERCVLLSSDPAFGHTDAAARADLAHLFPSGRQCRGILHCRSLDIPEPDAPQFANCEASQLQAAESLGCQSVLAWLQATVRHDWAKPPRFFVVTAGTSRSSGPTTNCRPTGQPNTTPLQSSWRNQPCGASSLSRRWNIRSCARPWSTWIPSGSPRSLLVIGASNHWRPSYWRTTASNKWLFEGHRVACHGSPP